MRKLGLALVLALAAASLVVAAGGASASSDVVGWVYVNDNTTGVNTVAGFDRHADGTLTPLAGSPFTIGGAGTGHGTASQGSLQRSADGRYLLAVDAGSNQNPLRARTASPSNKNFEGRGLDSGPLHVTTNRVRRWTSTATRRHIQADLAEIGAVASRGRDCARALRAKGKRRSRSPRVTHGCGVRTYPRPGSPSVLA